MGGLGFDGIVGMVAPGEGKRGAISGDNSVYGDNGGSGIIVGAADIVGEFFSWEEVEDKDSDGETRKATMSATRKQKVAILSNDNGINHPFLETVETGGVQGREGIVGKYESIYDRCHDYYNFDIMTNDQCGLILDATRMVLIVYDLQVGMFDDRA